MDTSNCRTWQRLMDDAYAKWQAKRHWKYSTFLGECTTSEKRAVLLGNLNYQVGNGGFSQWVNNGYGQHGLEVIAVLEEINTKLSLDLAKNVKQLLEFVDLTIPSKGCDDYWIRDHSWDDDDYCPGPYFANSLDQWYYRDVQPLFVPEVEAYLAARLPDRLTTLAALLQDIVRLPDASRKEVFEFMDDEYCLHCGRANPVTGKCRCLNDT